MDNYQLENFIEFCDDMQITEEGFFKNYIKRKIKETKDWRNEHSKPIRNNTENKNTNVDNSSQKENGLITKEEFHAAINKVKSIASQYKIPEFKYWTYENDDAYEKYTKDKYDVIIIAYLYFGDYVDDHFNGDPDEWIDSDGYKSFDNATKEMYDKIEQLSTKNIRFEFVGTGTYCFVRMISDKNK